MEFAGYPFSNPVAKFLDWANGVVGRESWELREGIVREGSGEDRAKARDKESILFRKEGFLLNSWRLHDDGVGGWGGFLMVEERVDNGGNGERRWAPNSCLFDMNLS